MRFSPVRFFFALRPDAVAAGELAALAEGLAGRHGGRALAAADIHLTLAFVGRRERADQEKLAALLQGLPAQIGNDGTGAAAAPSDGPIRLERLGTFGRGLLWIGPPATMQRGHDANGPAGPIAGEIRTRLRAAGIDFDARPLVLHATLVRGARAPASGLAGLAGRTGGRRIIAADDGATVDPAVVARAWSLALGFSGDPPATGRRYRWSRAMPQ